MFMITSFSLVVFSARWSITLFYSISITLFTRVRFVKLNLEFSAPTATMHSYSIVSLLFFLVAAQASILSTTNIATVLAVATSHSSLTIPADAMVAIAKLGTGGATASTLSAADKAAISSCTSTAQANTASKANLGGGTGTAGNIAL
jgi:hypothetical protein